MLNLKTLLLLAAVAPRALSSGAPATPIPAGDAARGWGDAFAWQPLAAGRAEANATGKPLLLLIWKTWCGACKALRPQFAASAELAALANDFVFVNTADDEEPQGAEFAPDGGYIPRILFLSPAGDVIVDARNAAAGEQYSAAAAARATSCRRRRASLTPPPRPARAQNTFTRRPRPLSRQCAAWRRARRRRRSPPRSRRRRSTRTCDAPRRRCGSRRA